MLESKKTWGVVALRHKHKRDTVQFYFQARGTKDLKNDICVFALALKLCLNI